MPNTDCRHFRTSEPCQPHKDTRARCGECTVYDPIHERILIVKLGATGDVLRTTSCLPPLKARYPRSHITWVTRSSSRAGLAWNPAIDRVLTVDGNYLEFLMAEEFDLAIGPDADLLSASIMRLAHAHEKRGCIADGHGGVRPLGRRGACVDAHGHRRRTQTGKSAHIRRMVVRDVRAANARRHSVPCRERVVARAHRHVSCATDSECAAAGGVQHRGEHALARKTLEVRARTGGLAQLVKGASPDTAVILVGGPR